MLPRHFFNVEIHADMTQAYVGPVYDWDEVRTDKDLALLGHLRWVMKEFSDRICAASQSQAAQTIETLRLAPMYDFAEFFFTLTARKLESDADIETMVELHNSYIVNLTRDKGKMLRLGLKLERLLSAIFTADTKPRLLQTWREQPGALDQSNLARFLAGVMSTETARKLVVASHAAGFLERRKTSFGTMVVTSTGVMERVFGSAVRELRGRIEGAVIDGGNKIGA